MKRIKREKGQAMVEFALILPILILLLGPVVDLGRTVYTKTQLQNISSDLLHMTILENEYSYQGGSFKAIEDKVIKEDTNLPPEHMEHLRGQYITKKVFDKFVNTGGLDSSQLSSEKLDSFVSLGPIKSGFEHQGHYPKLIKRVRAEGDSYAYSQAGYDKYGKHRQGYNEDGYDVYGYDKNGVHRDGYDKNGYDKNGYDRQGYNNKGYDINGLDRLGYNGHFTDVNGYPADRKEAHNNRHKRWELAGMESFDNSTYYREVKVRVPYEMEYITFMGKMLFGDSISLESTASGIIYMGGDGRDVTDPIS